MKVMSFVGLVSAECSPRNPWRKTSMPGESRVFVHLRAGLLSWLRAIGCGMEPNLVASGLVGYNAVILASALELRRTPWPLAIVGVAGTAELTSAALALIAIPLSASFVITEWIVLAIEPGCCRRMTDAPVASPTDSVA